MVSTNKFLVMRCRSKVSGTRNLTIVAKQATLSAAIVFGVERGGLTVLHCCPRL
jgi:hypothetical protein